MFHSSGSSFENIGDQNMPGPSSATSKPSTTIDTEMMAIMMDRLAQMEARYEQLAHYIQSQPAPAPAPVPVPVPAPAPIPQPAEPAQPVDPKLAKPEFTTENTKVLYALSFIQGHKIDNWKNEIINRALNWRDHGGYDPVVSNFTRFSDELEKTFGDPNPRETAISTLSALRQGNEPAEEYVMKFEALRADTGYNNVALVELFKQGMNPRLLN
ncbi:Retrotransposon-derived protein peg10 [Pleurotus ostreatus]|nr:Retrotransposon-derived protein peg10 [Pleurotus ostreatus]